MISNLEAAVAIIDSLAWPAVATGGVLLFRKQILQLVAKLKSMDTPLGRAEFSNEVEGLARAASEIARPSNAPEVPALPESTNDPRGLFAAGWALIHQALINAASNALGLAPTLTSPSIPVRALKEAGLLTPATEILMTDARRVSNRVLQTGSEVHPTFSEAMSFLSSAQAIAETIKREASLRPQGAGH
jgi:hypothetical protein